MEVVYLAKPLFTILWAELIGKKEFAIATFDPKDETFVVHIAFLRISNTSKAYSFEKTQIAFLQADETLTTVFPEYSGFVDIFSPKLATELSMSIKINSHVIDVVNY